MRNLMEIAKRKSYKYEIELMMYIYKVRIHCDSLEAYEQIKSEFAIFMNNSKAEAKHCLNFYISSINDSLSFEYFEDMTIFQYKNGYILRDNKDTRASYCFYQNTEESELFRLSIIKSLASIALQDNSAVIHGSLIKCNDKGLTFIGHSGAGKSALAGGMVLKYGFELVADDGYILKKEKSKLIGYGLSCLTGIDKNVTDKLEIELTEELIPDTSNIMEVRKRKYVPINIYKKDSYAFSADISKVIFMIQDGGKECWSRLLEGKEKEKLIHEYAIVRYLEDVPNRLDIQAYTEYFASIPCHICGLSYDYINNLQYIKDTFIDLVI